VQAAGADVLTFATAATYPRESAEAILTKTRIESQVLIVGGGPVGLTLALALARAGVASLVVERRPGVAMGGSKAMVLARHSIEAFDRIGCGELFRAAALRLARSRTFYRGVEILTVDFDADHRTLPRFVNLQQTETERILFAQVSASPLIETRFDTEVLDCAQDAEGVSLTTTTGTIRGLYVVGTDGIGSTVRARAEIGFPGRSYEDRFAIADVRASLQRPPERRIYFQGRGSVSQVLVLPQPKGEWRIDCRLVGAADPDWEPDVPRMHEQIRRFLGVDDYELVWSTTYRFQQRIATRFRKGRLFLAGDAAHAFAPFGARGLNSGIEDACNLAWKLAYVLRRHASDGLLDTYDVERRAAARVNLRITGRTMKFMAPQTPLQRTRRALALEASLRSPRLRRFVRDSRLAEPSTYGSARRAPIGRLSRDLGLQQNRTDSLASVVVGSAADGLAAQLSDLPVRVVDDRAWDANGRRAFLVRPDGYVAAVVRSEARDVREAVASLLHVTEPDSRLETHPGPLPGSGPARLHPRRE
jgi:2-polyprenyl-6-methoxyphenol hydroxylase-like FAD-dependent oxidoreductase